MITLAIIIITCALSRDLNRTYFYYFKYTLKIRKWYVSNFAMIHSVYICGPCAEEPDYIP